MKPRDVAIVGGGPAGLALSIGLASRGLDVVLFERNELPLDKACGEGVMPTGLRALEGLGVRHKLPANECAPFRGIRYLEEDGAALEGRFEGEGGLGIRRTALSNVLVAKAREVGVDLRPRCGVRGHQREHDRIRLFTAIADTEAKVLVAADGLHSPLRREAGLEGAPVGVRRYGLRRHFRVAPWSDCVEVHFGVGVEAYVTPCGPERVGIAFLWEHAAVGTNVSFEALLSRFPLLHQRCAGAEPLSRAQGAGPFWHSARALVTDRFALLGDAAGYVDALTGEGVSLGLTNAAVLAEVLPDALTRGATRGSLERYDRHARTAFARYERLTRALLTLARNPRARRLSLSALRRVPSVFGRLLRAAVE